MGKFILFILVFWRIDVRYGLKWLNVEIMFVCVGVCMCMCVYRGMESNEELEGIKII